MTIRWHFTNDLICYGFFLFGCCLYLFSCLSKRLIKKNLALLLGVLRWKWLHVKLNDLILMPCDLIFRASEGEIEKRAWMCVLTRVDCDADEHMYTPYILCVAGLYFVSFCFFHFCCKWWLSDCVYECLCVCVSFFLLFLTLKWK